jgi:hypothetical protein
MVKIPDIRPVHLPELSVVWGDADAPGSGPLEVIGVGGHSSKSDGVQGTSEAENRAGVKGTHNGVGFGIQGYSKSLDAVHGVSDSDAHAGVSGINNGKGFGVWGYSQGGEAGHFEGNVGITGFLTLTGGMEVQSNADIVFADCAEDFEVAASSDAEPGTVMVLNEDGLLVPCADAYDTRVAGIVSGAGHFRPAIVLGRKASDARSAPLALVGKAFCRVDADYGPIRSGDLLTSSPTAGHAMVAADRSRALGAIIGKALRPLSAGRALIPVLICSR